uniref:EamA domain-containing protein n=1 Tax=Pyrodinium bahamense TaxID=73915 RepID=A0A7S0AVR0_9DINO|mmetsp:Transcript_42963/g.119580  ORF Transcript_42963/g.119580 Transcript_42963/m.119580 type:complete len:380 (+) Transcript_42963:132-1271(+)
MAVATERGYGTLENADLAIKKEQRKLHSNLTVHLALILVFTLFGGGSFLSKFGIHGASPLVFEAVREVGTGPAFLALSRALHGRCLPDRSDLLRVLLCSLCFAGSQAAFFLGLKYEDPTVGSTWQTALPIFTTSLAVLAGFEQASCQKASGIVLASGGAAWMTMGAIIISGSSRGGADAEGGGMMGHVMFFGQSILNSSYIVFSKALAEKYGGVLLTGWSFTLGSACLVSVALLAEASTGFAAFMCHDHNREVMLHCAESMFRLTPSMTWPLLYEIVCCSAIAWYLLGWALQHTKASMVSVYCVIQPCSTCVLSLMAIAMRGRTWADSYGISTPGLHSILGAVLIFAGLSVTFTELGPAKGQEEECAERTDKITTATAP